MPQEATNHPYREEFPLGGAARTWNETHPGKTFMALFSEDPLSNARETLPYYPFSTRTEWELASFLLRSGLSMAKIDEFLKIEMIKVLPLSFRTAQDLVSRAEQLPSGPRWVASSMSTTIPTKNPITLFYRNPVECLQALMRSPLVSDYIQFTPFKLYESCAKTMRLYTEWLSGDAAWFMQEKLQPTATLLGTVLSSDKTNISSGTGNRFAHPLLISLANISAEFRNKATNHAFLLLALVPIPRFIHPKSKIRGVLEARLFHESLDIVLQPLKDAARVGVMLSDPLGNSQMTLNAIAQIRTAVEDEWDLESYEKQAMKHRLNGVHKPFWRDWDLSNPAIFLTSEPLHHWHRMFWDHDAKWCINAVGAGEIDFRFSILQPHTGYRHFKEGISMLKQVTGREQRDMQRYIIPVISGVVSPDFLTAIRSLLDFRYFTQAPVISEDVCRMIDESLSIFHQFKKAIIDVGARKGGKGHKLTHWQIPKLEFMQSVTAGMRLSGCAIQWTADTTEHAHIRLVKEPARASNNHGHESQIVRKLDCEDKIMYFDLATAMRDAGVDFKASAPQESTADNDQEHEKDLGASKTNDMSSFTIGTTAELLSMISSVRALPGSHAGAAGISTYGITNYFYRASILKKGLDISAIVPHRTVQSSPTTVFHLSRDPKIGACAIRDIAQQFGIEDLEPAISRYISKMESIPLNTFVSDVSYVGGRAPEHPPRFVADKVQVWTSLRLQSTAYHYPHPILPPVTLKAEPKIGGRDSAIFCVDSSRQWPHSCLSGHIVAEIHLIFRLVLPKNRPHIPDRFLAYVQTYTIIPQPNPRNPNRRGEFPNQYSGLYLLKRSAPQPSTRGVIIPLDQLRTLVDVVPNFGGKADTRLTCQNSLAYSCEFWLNKYFDKELFYALSMT
ncbi:hypothetical protein BJ165DRAFT_1341898 [Panaeolus papilionaceus]|nr:hypothetical protein BJ165DRAFT_1341898 [Panaeolus papilionaceus]